MGTGGARACLERRHPECGTRRTAQARRGNSEPSWLAQCKTDPVRTTLNLIWLVLSGLWLALAYAFAGVLMCVLIITIPFGVASFRLAA